MEIYLHSRHRTSWPLQARLYFYLRYKVFVRSAYLSHVGRKKFGTFNQHRRDNIYGFMETSQPIVK